jgi:hypothetical protein
LWRRRPARGRGGGACLADPRGREAGPRTATGVFPETAGLPQEGAPARAPVLLTREYSAMKEAVCNPQGLTPDRFGGFDLNTERCGVENGAEVGGPCLMFTLTANKANNAELMTNGPGRGPFRWWERRAPPHLPRCRPHPAPSGRRGAVPGHPTGVPARSSVRQSSKYPFYNDLTLLRRFRTIIRSISGRLGMAGGEQLAGQGPRHRGAERRTLVRPRVSSGAGPQWSVPG